MASTRTAFALNPAVSVVVIAFRQREPLAECLAACVHATSQVPGGAELIVIDNGGLAAFVREAAPGARVLEPGRNTGFAGGVNLGVAAAHGRWVALINDDARIAPNALAALLAAGEHNERIGSVAAQVRFAADPGRINSAGIDVNSLGVATERLAGRPILEANGQAEIFGASACFALYRMEMLEHLGGFAEGFFAYLEDVDLAWRARAAGWRSVYQPRALAYHRGSGSSGVGSASKYYLVGRNRVWLLARNATTVQLLRALPGLVLYDLAYMVYVAALDQTLAPLRGRLAGLRRWHTLRRTGASTRRKVVLRPAYRDWLASLRQFRSYRNLGAPQPPS